MPNDNLTPKTPDSTLPVRYQFTQNDPFDKSAPIKMVVAPRMPSPDFMRSIREFPVPPNSLALWFLGQNTFILRAASGRGQPGPLVCIDPYLTDYCGEKYTEQSFRVNRQLPVFIEPEDLNVDFIFCTHSHDDHTDPETLRRCGNKESTRFVGPYESYRRFQELGLPRERLELFHPNQDLEFEALTVRGTFALPTDATDLNHMGIFFQFENGIKFLNSGDTAYSELLSHTAEYRVDIMSVCINGGFLNLSHFDAARIVKAVKPEVVIPCHYDMMVNNVGDPDMFRASLEIVGAESRFHMMSYNEPWVYKKGEF